MNKTPQIKTKTDIYYSLRRYYVDTFYLDAIDRFSPNDKILDLGGTQLKRGCFNIYDYNFDVVNINISRTKGTDIQGDANLLPFPDNYFDYVICSEVLEHVPNPISVLQQVNRILKPGGSLLATIPFLFPIHADPYDYGRYTNHYWTENLKKTGFPNSSVMPQGRFNSVMLDFIAIKYRNTPDKNKIYSPIHSVVLSFLSHENQKRKSRIITHIGNKINNFIASSLTKIIMNHLPTVLLETRYNQIITNTSNDSDPFTTGFAIVATK
jgi:SAM-dependent methyltransferase